MSGLHYTPAPDVTLVRVGSIVIDAAGYTAETDAEAALLDECEHLHADASQTVPASVEADEPDISHDHPADLEETL